MSSSMKTTEKKKLSGKTKGYLILIVLLVASYGIFKIVTPDNFGSPKQILQYFQASLLAATGAVGFYFVMVMVLREAENSFHDRYDRTCTYL